MLLAAVAILLPGRVQAQFTFAPGHYQLASGAQGDADLKLVLAEDDKPGAMAGIRNGQERSFRPAQVTSFSIDGHSFARQDGIKRLLDERIVHHFAKSTAARHDVVFVIKTAF